MEDIIKNKIRLPIPVQELAFLQAYLYNVFSFKELCEKNFNHAEWFLNEKHTEEEVSEIKTNFRNIGIECDCDIIYKLDLRELSANIIKPHNDK